MDVIGGTHPGTAFTELRFYPPAWVKQFHDRSGAARDWCAALTIGSLSEDPVNGITLNPACQGEIRGGIECVSFVFLTRSGTPSGPPNPLQFSSATPGGGRLAGLGIAGGAVYDAFVAAAAAGHGLPLGTRDRRRTEVPGARC